MSLTCYVGPQGNILNEANADHCHRLRLSSPILSMSDISALKSMSSAFPGWEVAEIDITFSKYKGEAGYVNQLDNIFIQVNDAILSGAKIAILSDRLVDNERVPLSALVACAGVHHYLVKNKMRSKIALVVETGEARDVHHFCCLLGYGADAICMFCLM